MRTWSMVGLAAVLIVDLWLRGHTLGPALHNWSGLNVYPIRAREAQPLDSDEAIYAYIGRRISEGAVMYRDLTENKPPLGYWLYALAVTLGGPNELAVRIMPVPMVLLTIILVWLLALRLCGPGAALLAAALYAAMSTDPYLCGNSANMEHMINLFSMASLVLLVSAWARPGRGRLAAAGACLGAACLVKPVALTHLPVYVLALGVRNLVDVSEWPRRRGVTERLQDIAALGSGLGTVWLVAAIAVILQGAGWDAYEDIFRYGPALMRDTPSEPNAPPLLIRWFTGNADLSGALPWPFGRSGSLEWWGAGTWPVWLSATVAIPWLCLSSRASSELRLTMAWTLSAWVQVALPRLFWQHYYLLPVPGLAVIVAVFLADRLADVRSRTRAAGLHALTALAVMAGLVWMTRSLASDYLLTSPKDLSVHSNGGRHWADLRTFGRHLAKRATCWSEPSLFIWGWQTPLYIYSGLKGVTKQVYADPLIRHFAGTQHPLIRPRVDRLMNDLRANAPPLIVIGDPPFPALRSYLQEGYRPSHLFAPGPDGRGLWVERGKFDAFESYSGGRADESR